MLMSLSRSASDVKLWAAGGFIVAAALLFDGTEGYGNWAVLYISLAASFLWFAVRVVQTGQVRLAMPHVLALLLFVYAAQSLAWSPDSQQGAFQLLNAATLLAVFFAAPYIQKAIPWAIMVAFVGALLMDNLLPWGGFGNENFAAEFLLISFPFAALILILRWPIWGIGAVVLTLSYLIGTNPSRVEYVTAGMMALGFGAWLAYVKGDTNFKRVAGIVIMGLVILTGAVVYATADLYSITSRTEIWLGTWEAFRQAPIFGHGFGSWMHFYPPLQEFFLTVTPDASLSQTALAGFPPAAHLEPLQLLAELGIVGFVIAAAFLVSLRKMWRRDEYHWAALLTVLVATPVALIEFPLQIPPTAMLVALALGILAGRADRMTPIPILARWWTVGVTAPAAIVIAVLGYQIYYSELNLARSKDATRQHEFLAALEHADRAMAFSTLDWRIRSNLLFAINNADRFKVAIVEISAQDRAYEIAQTASPYFLGHLLIRYEQLRRGLRNAEEAVEIVRQIERQAPRRAGRILKSMEIINGS
jgi:O-antigen ligase